MSTNPNQGSARIYQFPAGGRSALGGRRQGETNSIDRTAPLVTEALCSGSWYHEEAIQEARSTSKPVSKPLWER
jgi:Protein of unknown function (DUF2735)